MGEADARMRMTMMIQKKMTTMKMKMNQVPPLSRCRTYPSLAGRWPPTQGIAVEMRLKRMRCG